MISVVIISKNEASLDDTLADLVGQVDSLSQPCEIVVVDASAGRLDYIRRRHEASVRWLDFQPPPRVRISIPHQRNAGVREARGDIVVFTDAGCRLTSGWLARLVAPLWKQENVVAGVAQGLSGERPYDLAPLKDGEVTYLRECATMNLAFRREVFERGRRIRRELRLWF